MRFSTSSVNLGTSDARGWLAASGGRCTARGGCVMRAVVYKRPFEVAVGERSGPQAGHPDDVIFRAPSAAGQAKDQLSGEGTDKSVGVAGDQTQPHGGERYRPRQGLRSQCFQHVCQRPDLAASVWSAPVWRSRRGAGWGKTKKWPQSPRSSNEAQLSRQLGEARRPSRSGGNANGYRFYA